MQSADLAILKDIPGYKIIMKTVLKHQIQQLVEQLSETTGEESILLTASVSDGSLSHLGSESGKNFLDGHDEIKSQFLGFVLKSHHSKKTEKQFAAGPGRQNNTQGIKYTTQSSTQQSVDLTYQDESDAGLYSEASYYSEPQHDNVPAMPVTQARSVGKKRKKVTKAAPIKSVDVKPRPKRSAEAMKSPAKFGIYVDEIDDTELSDTEQEQIKTAAATVTEPGSEDISESYTDIVPVPVSGPIPVLQSQDYDEGASEFAGAMGEFGSVVKREAEHNVEEGTVMEDDDPSWEPGMKKRRKSSGSHSVSSVGNVSGDQAQITAHKVRLSAAERQRRFRARRDADPVKRQIYLLQSKKKYQRQRQTGKKKLVKEMSVAEHAAIKQKWRRSKQRNRLKNEKKFTKKAFDLGTCALKYEVTESGIMNDKVTNDVNPLNEKVNGGEFYIKSEIE